MSTNAKKRKSLRERRKIQRRKLQIRAAAALLSLVAVTFLLIFHFTPQNTQADSEPKAPTYKYYTSIRVSSGDTLWDIAKEYRTEEYSDISSYIAEVREINHLSSTRSRTVCISAFRITPRSINLEIQEILYIIRLCKQSKKNSFQNARNLLKQHVREAWFTK